MKKKTMKVGVEWGKVSVDPETFTVSAKVSFNVEMKKLPLFKKALNKYVMQLNGQTELTE